MVDFKGFKCSFQISCSTSGKQRFGLVSELHSENIQNTEHVGSLYFSWNAPENYAWVLAKKVTQLRIIAFTHHRHF